MERHRSGPPRGPRRDQRQEGTDQFSREKIQQVIRQGGKTLVDEAEELGKRLSRDVTTSQIRNVFGAVKTMEMDMDKGKFNAHEFVLLKPKLAYAAARANNQGARQLKNVLSWAIDEVGDDETKFVRFVNFFEAILAYHKAAGGR